MGKISIAQHAALFADDKLRIKTILDGALMKDRDKKVAIYNFILQREILSNTAYVVTMPDKNPYIILGLSNEALALPKHGRGGDGIFSYLAQRYGLGEREKLTQFVYDNLRLYAFQHGAEVELRRFAFFDKATEALYLSRYNGMAFRIDGAGVTTTRNGQGVYFADDDFGVACHQEVVVRPNGILLKTLASPNFAVDTPSGITPEQQRRAMTVWMFALAFPDLMPTKPLILFEGVPGAGKCLGLGTLVLMFDGSTKKVEDVLVGDRLMGPDSKPRKVLSTTRGKGALYRVTPTKGDSWVCNDKHILTLVASHTGKIEDIAIKDYLAENPWRQVELKQFSAGVDFRPTKKKLPIDPYFLGFWYGDGTKDLNSVTISKPDPEVAELMTQTAQAWNLQVRTFTNTSGCPGYSISTRTHSGGKIPNTLLHALRAVVEEGLTIPIEYLTASRDDRALFLAGILDADGSLDKGGFDICQKQKGVAEGVCFLARSLGLRATMRFKMATIRNKETGEVKKYPCWRITLSGEMSWLPLRIPRRKPNPRRQVKDVRRTGIKVEPIGIGEYAGFELDGDGRFLLGDFTVTHNSSIAQGLQLALLGAKKSMIVSKGKENDFGVLLLRSPIALIDNMDNYISWIPDAVAAYATSGVWPSRKLYTDGEEVTIRPQAFIAIASKNPASFRAEDVAERMVIIRLARREGFTRQEKIEANILNQRGLLLGEYLYYLNEIVREIRAGGMEGENDEGEIHRMADFAAMARVVAKVFEWTVEDETVLEAGQKNDHHAAVAELLLALQAERDAFVNEEDPLADLLNVWLDQFIPGVDRKPKRFPNVGRIVSTQELFHELEQLAQAQSRQFYKTPRTLVQKLRSPHLTKEFVIITTIVRTTRTYQIARRGGLALVSTTPSIPRLPKLPKLEIEEEVG